MMQIKESFSKVLGSNKLGMLRVQGNLELARSSGSIIDSGAAV